MCLSLLVRLKVMCGREMFTGKEAPVLDDDEIVSRLRPYWMNALLRIDYTSRSLRRHLGP